MALVFGEFVFDAESRQLWRDGVEVHLPPRPFRLLEVLLEARPKAISKADLIDRIWPGVIVEESNLKTVVSELRNALGDLSRPPRWIRTVHRHGYAFCGEARTIEGPGVSGAGFELHALGRWFPLAEGVSEIGRDRGCLVRIASGEVSRRHARITIRAGIATLADLGSKNGTWVGRERISGERELADGDRFRIADFPMSFHVRHPDQPTRTAIVPGSGHGPGSSNRSD